MDGLSYEELERLRDGLIDASINDGYDVNNALKEIGTQMDKVRTKPGFSKQEILYGAMRMNINSKAEPAFAVIDGLGKAAGFCGHPLCAAVSWGLRE